MYNIFKGQIVPGNADSTQVIDSNDRVGAFIERYNEKLKRKREEELANRVESFLESLEADEEGLPIIPRDEEGNYLLPTDFEGNPLLYVHSDGMLSDEPEEEKPEDEETTEAVAEVDLAAIEAQTQAMLDDAKREAEKLVSEAELQASEILDDAAKQAEIMKEEAKEAGSNEGYQAGADRAAQEFSQKEAELSKRRENMEREFAEREQGMEGRLCDVICDIVGKVFEIEFNDKKEIILHLVDNVISNSPGSKMFLIRVNDENYEVLNENRQKLREKIGAGIEFDIIRDPILTVEQCQIETDGGVYDCGMDVQMKNLLKDIRALSLV